MTQNLNTYKLIVLEGLDGSGKSTISREVVKELENKSVEVATPEAPAKSSDSSEVTIEAKPEVVNVVNEKPTLQ